MNQTKVQQLPVKQHLIYQDPMTYGDANKVCDLKKLTPQKVTVRVWFEGEDPECVNKIQESTMEAILTFGGEADAS